MLTEGGTQEQFVTLRRLRHVLFALRLVKTPRPTHAWSSFANMWKSTMSGGDWRWTTGTLWANITTTMFSSNFIFHKQLQSVSGQTFVKTIWMVLSCTAVLPHQAAVLRDTRLVTCHEREGTHHLLALENLPVQGMKTVCKINIF